MRSIWYILAAGMCIPGASAQQSCESLTSLRLDRASIVAAVTVEAAPLKPQPGAWFPLPPTTVPAHCEVRGVARPSSDSEINFELWLPPAAMWNGKYQQQGNGGWAGSIPSWTLATPLARGYAAGATDDGHSAKVPTPDASFATGHPEKLIDFGHRAVHETAVQAKAILRAYYGRETNRSYFNGCSDGGREALMEAQRYPEDFDGIIAGAPANNWTRHFTGFVWNETALGGPPSGILPAAKLPLLQKAALAACDGLDGVKDGLIEDPRDCRFDPATLQCTAAVDGPDCLAAAQVDAVAKVYRGPVSPRTGEQIYPGYEPGTEAGPTGWAVWITGPVQSMFGNSFYSGAVYENPKWDWRSMDFDRDLEFANEKVGPILNAYNPDLRSFRAHGGKLLQYHGWGDAAIAPRDSIAYYERVQSFLKQFPDPRSSQADGVQSFYRLFMVPGMGHCGAGTGPNHFGNDAIADPGVWPQDAEHDLVLALDRWVTQGIAPDRIVGTGKIGGDPKDASKGVKMTRPLCAFPKVAHYRGTGDANDAANFDCVENAAGARANGFAAAAPPGEVAVRTGKGVVEGARKGGVRVFLGIPYAAPPVGALRFRAPEPHAAWQTPLQATRPGSSCPQAPSDDPAGRASTNEDCLYLNVWAPGEAGARRPVMVWIHGGGFTEGDGAAPQYDGTHLVEFADVVLVTINYRVGPFGFLVAPALSRENAQGISGNYGILDQQAALRWVRENISGFGGDPGNVTIFGESAGAMSVTAQLASPLAAGLFHRAIVQSGARNGATPPLEEAAKRWAALVAAVGCKDAKDAAGCLRAAPVDAFLKAQGGMPNAVTDGVVLPLSPPEAFRTGQFNKVPVMAGNTAKEFYLFAAREETRSKGKPLEWADLPAQLAHMPFGGTSAAPAQVLERYPAGRYANAVSALATMRGDALFACTTDATLRALAAYVPAYGYQLDITGGFQQQPLPAGNHLLPAGVSYHTTDLGYVFNNRNDASPLSGRDLARAHMIQGYWTRFAATGDPNGAAGQVGPKWPRYRSGTHTLLSIRDTPALQTDFVEEHRCDIWNRPTAASNSRSK